MAGNFWYRLDQAYRNKNGRAFFQILEEDIIRPAPAEPASSLLTIAEEQPSLDITIGTLRVMNAIYREASTEMREQYGISYLLAASRGNLDSQEGDLLEVEDDSPR